MPLSVLIEMTISAILTVWSPGPNNILLLSTASKYGVSGNLSFMTGIWSGSLTLMCLSGFFCSTLGTVIPGIQPVMKYLGAAYILYLAWQTLKRRPPSDQVQEKKPTWLMGFILQLVNVKIIIYGLTMFSAYILPYESRSYRGDCGELVYADSIVSNMSWYYDNLYLPAGAKENRDGFVFETEVTTAKVERIEKTENGVIMLFNRKF